MTDQEAREVFNQMIEKATDKDTIAKLEMVREFLTNPDFRANLEQFTWDNRES